MRETNLVKTMSRLFLWESLCSHGLCDRPTAESTQTSTTVRGSDSEPSKCKGGNDKKAIMKLDLDLEQ